VKSIKPVRLSLWAAAVAVLAIGGAVLSGCASFGASPSGARQARIEKSPEWRDGKLENPQGMWNDWRAMLSKFMQSTPELRPDGPVPVVSGGRAQFAAPAASGLRVTWFGHSSSLIEIDGVTVLTDPFWGERASPFTWVGPTRWYPPPVALADLPKVDVVVISHDHYDHLDRASIEAMRGWKNVFVVPLGIGAHLEAWGIARERIVELDWWQSARVGGIDIVSTPARHASGRVIPQSGKTLWTGFALVGPRHRAYYSGDTGLLDAMTDIGARYGPFDVALIESGQYDAAWPDWHLGPEQAVEANRRVRGKVMIPVHWGLLVLASHTWTEPVERVLAAARCAGTTVMTPRPGQSVEPAADPLAQTPAWWPKTAWQTAAERPVIATRSGDPLARVTLAACTTAPSPTSVEMKVAHAKIDR
jgi:L-ascorbate metabolism protein UlaG (beta-lactamase superfamily)